MQDEFTLFNYIASFKTWCFVMCGVLPVFADFFVFYFDISSRQIDDHGDDPTALTTRHLYDHDYSLLSWYNLVSNRAFIALWLVCWVVFARYLRVRSLHFAEEETGTGEHSGKQRIHHEVHEVHDPKPAPARERNSDRVDLGKSEDDSGITIYNAVHTGDQDTGDREQTLLMKWDAIAVLLHVILGLLDLCFRMEISVVQVRYLVITPIACPVLPHGDLDGAGYSLHYHAVAVSITYGCSLDYIWLQAVLDPTREELLFETFICTTLEP